MAADEAADLREAGALLIWLGMRDLHKVRNYWESLIVSGLGGKVPPDNIDP